ncbi:MAG: hypothetical protein P4L55_06740 [Syntrophobacteraceae bacterium]|nr:hypothetical protein [Syntrophobacteraceae bacterium]
MKDFCTSIVLAVLNIAVAGCVVIPPEKAGIMSNESLLKREVLPSKGQPEELPGLTAKSTLNDYLVYAALNNPGLKAAFLTGVSGIGRKNRSNK